MGAEAYATGSSVAFTGAPDLHTAAHEAAHVVQQRGGVQLKGGVGEANDPYERHADAVADQVVQGKSAEATTRTEYGSSMVAADGRVTVAEGRLVADAPLRFVRDADRMRAVAFDGGTTYAAIERVTFAVPWSATGAGSGCCAWWEHTLWRAAPGALDAGLLRAVTPPNQAWSVIDLHQPGAIEPRWRVLLTQGQGAVVAAAVSPRADRLVLVVATSDGAASVQARRVTDGGITWSADLGSPASEWRRGDGRIAYRRDGARIAVLVQDPGRCESCTAIEVFDTVRGDRLQRVGLETIFAPRFTTIGLTDDTVWVFEHVPPSSTDLATRPQRCAEPAILLDAFSG
jgi:hypothetical protein